MVSSLCYSLGCPVEETSKHTLSQELNAIYQNSREYHLFHSVLLNTNSESCHSLPVFSFLVVRGKPGIRSLLSCPLVCSWFHKKKQFQEPVFSIFHHQERLPCHWHQFSFFEQFHPSFTFYALIWNTAKNNNFINENLRTRSALSDIQIQDFLTLML